MITVPPQHPELVRFGIEDQLLEFAPSEHAAWRIGFTQHPLVQFDFSLVFEIAIVRDKDRTRQIRLHVEQWVCHAAAIGLQHDFEIAAAASPRSKGRSASSAG